MECLLCYDVWKESDGRALCSPLNEENSLYFCKALDLPTSDRALQRMYDSNFCNACRDQVFQVKCLMEQLKSLEERINSFTVQFRNGLVNSHMKIIAGSLVQKERKGGCRENYGIGSETDWRECILKELGLLVEEIDEDVLEKELAVYSAPAVEVNDDPWIDDGFNPLCNYVDVSHETYSDTHSPERTSPKDSFDREDNSSIIVEAISATPTKDPSEEQQMMLPESEECFQALETKRKLVIRVERLTPSFIEAMTTGKKKSGRPLRHVKSTYQFPTHVTSELTQSIAIKIEVAATPCAKKLLACPYESCKSTSNSVTALRAHLKAIHKKHDNLSANENSERLPCPYDDCCSTFASQGRLNYHVTYMHEGKSFNPACNIDDCPRIFKSNKALQIHQRRIHFGLDPYVCNMKNCDATFARQNEYGLHLRTIHADIQNYNYKCNLPGCAKSFSKRLLLVQHHREFHGKIRRPARKDCPRCGKEFSSSKILQSHMTTHRDKRYPCDQCPKRLVSMKALARHKNTHYVQRNHPCDKCGKSYKNRAVLYRHVLYRCSAINEPQACAQCEKSFATPTLLKLHVRKWHEEKKYVCASCPKKFVTCNELILHEASHTSERPIICTACEAAFKTDIHLRRHRRNGCPKMKETPKESTLCICPTCGKTFKNVSYLSTHSVIHGEKKFACAHCPKKFYRNALLKRHEAYHFPDRPYICDGCGKCYKDESIIRTHKRLFCSKKNNERIMCDVCGYARFKFQGSLDEHRKQHQGEGPFPFECPKCDWCFQSKSAADWHAAAVHTELSCNKCSASFKNLILLRRHRKEEHLIAITGSGEWKCPDCDFTTASKNRLNAHCDIHLTALPYACFLCDQRFKHTISLGSHQRRKHKLDNKQVTKEREHMKCQRKTDVS